MITGLKKYGSRNHGSTFLAKTSNNLQTGLRSLTSLTSHEAY